MALHNIGRWRGTVALIAALVVAAAIGQAVIGRTVLRKAGLINVPAGYTSLAFTAPQSLPEQMSPAQKTHAVSFVIRNAGDSVRHYRWSVLLAQDAQARRVDTGEVRVRPGHAVPITRSEKFSCVRGTRIRIIINLARPSEAIGAWAACRSSKR